MSKNYVNLVFRRFNFFSSSFIHIIWRWFCWYGSRFRWLSNQMAGRLFGLLSHLRLFVYVRAYLNACIFSSISWAFKFTNVRYNICRNYAVADGFGRAMVGWAPKREKEKFQNEFSNKLRYSDMKISRQILRRKHALALLLIFRNSSFLLMTMDNSQSAWPDRWLVKRKNFKSI